MKMLPVLQNDIRHSVDFLEPLPTSDDHLDRICEVLSNTFGWAAEAESVEQKGLRASVVLYCVKTDLLGMATLEQLGSKTGTAQAVVDELVSDFCHNIGW